MILCSSSRYFQVCLEHACRIADPEHLDELFVTTCPLSHVRCARCQDFDTSSYCSCFNRCDNASILLKYIKLSFSFISLKCSEDLRIQNYRA